MKNKLFIWFIIATLLTSNSFAAVENYNDVDGLWIDINIDSNIKVTQETNSARLEQLITELTLFPQENYMQEIQSLEIKTEPEGQAEKTNGAIIYTWNNLYDNYYFGLEGSVQTKNIIPPIPDVNFPILTIDSSLKKYLEPTDNIDINDEILAKASSLAQGKDSLFEVVYTIADWVNTNIQYDLNTLTATAVQRSSWVLDNRQGVCDEITSLFISMLRSIGVPARFVSGMVYTNLDYSFGNHGWAEVYFPGYGWIPFDVTFGQYGWVDPSHVKLSDSVDSATYSAKYKWRSNGLEIEPQNLELKSEIISVGPKIRSPYNIEVSLIDDKVGPGSYIPLRVSVENTFNHFSSTSIVVTRSAQLTEDNVKQVLLKPKSRSDVFWVLKVPNNLNADYIYTADIEVKDSFGDTDTTSLDYASSYEKISQAEAQEIIDSYTKTNENTFSEFISLNCDKDKEYYYIYERASITCNIRNKTNNDIEDILICLQTECRDVDLNGQEEVDLIFDLDLTDFTTQTVVVDAEVNGNHVNDFIGLRVYREPSLHIDNVEFPKRVGYNQDFEFSAYLSSQTKLNDLKIRVNNKEYSRIDSLEEAQKIVLPLRGRDILYRTLKLSITYNDENGKEYKTEEEFSITVANVPWWGKLLYIVENLFV
mgnify:CR=1 FL=1